MGQVIWAILSFFIIGFFVIFARDAACDELNLNEYVSRYRAYDMGRNDGTGNSVHTSSSALAWGESYILYNYVMLYRVTEDSYWIEKITQHFDQMIYGMMQEIPKTKFRKFSADEIAKMVDRTIEVAKKVDFNRYDDNGHPLWNTEYPGWYASRYSVAYVKVADAKSKAAKLVPNSERISEIKRAHQVTGHKYLIKFHDDKHYSVTDLDLAKSDESEELIEISGNISEIPGASLKLEGLPEANDTFTVETMEPKNLQYTVHDGMVLYPIAQFIEIILRNPELQGKFGSKTESYIRLIREVFFRKWEKYWLDVGNDSGAYRFTESPTERFPDRILPHNQYNAMCRAYLVLQDESVLNDSILQEKATKMIRYFKGNLKPTGNAWTWNYWDWGTGEGEHSGPEDTSHASINVGTAIEAYHRGIEFSNQDMIKFANTLLDQMWNGSLEEPVLGDRVDIDTGDRYFPIRCWVELCEFNSKVWDVCLAMFRHKGEPQNLIPSMLYAQILIK